MKKIFLLPILLFGLFAGNVFCQVGIDIAVPGSKLQSAENIAIGYGNNKVAAPNNGAAILGNVGIGIADPGSKLQVAGNVLIGFNNTFSSAPPNGLAVLGKVGINEANPQHELHVGGSALITSLSGIGTRKVVADNNGVLTATTASSGINAAPTGTIAMTVSSTIPAGWVLCNGSSFDGNNSLYAGLWALLGNTYGGTGIADFKVPDLSERIPVGKSTTNSLGQTGGAETIAYTPAGTLSATFAGTSVSSSNGSTHTHPIPNHNHTKSITVTRASATNTANGGGTLTSSSNGSHSHGMRIDGCSGGSSCPSVSLYASGTITPSSSILNTTGAHTHTVNFTNSHTHTVSVTMSGTAGSGTNIGSSTVNLGNNTAHTHEYTATGSISGSITGTPATLRVINPITVVNYIIKL